MVAPKQDLTNEDGTPKTGATGDFPLGKLTPEDEGELQLALAIKDNTLIVDFGKPVAWLGLDKATAVAFGNSILEKADTLDD